MNHPADPCGTLFLVVGPSGAGKDTLMSAAKEALADRSGTQFPRRYVTRPASAGQEDHIPVSEAEFDRLLNEDSAFVLAWDAHGLRYGIPSTVTAHLAAGRDVVVNVSRAVVDPARQWFPKVKVLSVTVPENLLAARLRARGRESEDSIRDRLARARAYAVSGPDVTEIDNGRPIDEAARQMVDALSGE